MSITEKWIPISGFNGEYEISDFGRVKSNKYNRSKILKLNKHNKGYVKVNLTFNKKVYSKYVHRLVAEAFIKNHHNYKQINHKDENKLNNQCDNLEWCDCKYNINYGNGIKHRKSKLCKKVIQSDLEGNIIKIWNSIIEAEIEGGFTNSNITKCCKGDIKTHGGYIWGYERG